MSVASQDTYLNLTTPLSVVGSGGVVPGSGVDSVVSGANISTIGASVGDVTVALQPNLTNINSVGFATGGAISGISTINGTAYPAPASVPPVISVSTVKLDVPEFGQLSSGYGDGNAVSLELAKGLIKSYIELDATRGTVELGTYNLSTDAGTYISLAEEGGGITAPTVFDIGVVSGALNMSASTVNIRGNTTISTLTAQTLALSTIGPIIDAVSATPTQTVNILIGNMRMQGGTVPPSATGTTITWASRFGSVPTVYTGMAGAVGSSTVLIAVTAAGESSGTFSAPAGTPVGNTINWLAIGAA